MNQAEIMRLQNMDARRRIKGLEAALTAAEAELAECAPVSAAGLALAAELRRYLCPACGCALDGPGHVTCRVHKLLGAL